MRYRRYVTLIGCAIVGAFLLWPLTAAAHPLGNFTINHYSRLHFAGSVAQVKYVLDYAEIPTFQMKPDSDGDGVLSPAEANAFLDATLPGLVGNLHLTIGGREEPLKVTDRSAAFVPGQGGLPTLRLETTLEGALPSGWQGAGGTYADGNLSERLGWREIVVQGGDGVAINNASVPATDVSNELRDYPQNLLTSPLNVTSATFSLVPGSGGSDVGSRAASVPRPAASQGKPTDQVAALITADKLSPTVILVSILVALFWGAAHALSPGHGKTVVAAYLVGSRGTAKHAVFLGMTVTLTHTIGVFALGGITLWLSRYLLPETLYPWLNVISGGLVILIALILAYQRLRGILQPKSAPASDHSHDSFELASDGASYDLVHEHGGVAHSHLPPGGDGSRVTWRSLLALGVSGGLIPCPSALVLLLGAVALGRVGFGIVLVIAFSFGLAVLLTAIGLLMVYAHRLFSRFSFEARLPRLLPVASALVMALAGVGIVVEALRQAGVI
jgi:nickel/cobalt exporter